MKQSSRQLVLGALALLALSSPAAGQGPYIFFGGGATFPIGDYGDYAKTGWIATGGVGVDVGKGGTWLEAEGFFGSNKHSDVEGDKTNLVIGLAAIGHTFGAAGKKVRPYVVAGAGFLQHKYVPNTGTGDTETKFAYSGGTGLSFKMGARASFWVEGRFLGGTDTRIVPITAGFTLNLHK
ncbi:MAG TPA: hypothetical protein VFU23_13435 [Gemmatimonadales bacterium]|nr:hypothetical protein [Gemmatimonadales bacterium]